MANIAANVVDLLNDSQGGSDESYCRDVTDNSDDFEACMSDSGIGVDNMGAILDGISEVKSELQSQIRNSSVDRVIRGVLMVGVGLLVFRVHGRRTRLFADGLMPAKPIASAGTPPPVPPPPGAVPPASS